MYISKPFQWNIGANLDTIYDLHFCFEHLELQKTSTSKMKKLLENVETHSPTLDGVCLNQISTKVIRNSNKKKS